MFHGTDVGHTWESTGPRYLAYLEANGQKDTEEYKRTQENMEQGKRYYEIKATDEASSVRYREDRMVENFRRIYQELEAYAAPISWVSMEVHILWSRSIGTRTFAWQNS